MREGGYSQAMIFLSGARQEHVQFLKQLSEKDFWDYAQRAAVSTLPTQTGADDHEPSDAYLVCDLGSLGCVLPLADLHTVVPSPAYFSLLPDTPGWMPGLAAWSNEILAVIDLRAYLLQGTPASTRSPAMLLVTQYEDLFFGLLTPIIGTIPHLDTVHWQSPEQVETTCHFACPAALKGISRNTKDIMGMEEMEMALLLDTPVMLANIVKQMRKMAVYG
jgi:chemotaxis signal transduction protein